MGLIVVVTLIFSSVGNGDTRYQGTNTLEYRFAVLPDPSDPAVGEKKCLQKSRELKEYFKKVRGVIDVQTRCDFEM